jgi:hypothetical protein
MALVAPHTCRSELARDEREGAAFIQADPVIVDVHREQARSYKVYATLVNLCATSEVGAICMLIGKDRSHASIVRFWLREQTCSISAATASPIRKAP